MEENVTLTGTLYADTSTVYLPNFFPNVVYAHRETGDLTMQIMAPASNLPMKMNPSPHDEFMKDLLNRERPKDPRRFPAIIDVAGSGWSGTDGFRHLAVLGDFARRGYVVAAIAYRGTYKDDCRFPAAVQDVHEAIRFLRKHAEDYCVDVDRIALLGDSSGGHTVTIASVTGRDPRFNIGDNLDVDAAPNACVCFYAPLDFENLLADRRAAGKRKRFGEDTQPFEMYEMFRHDFEADPERFMKFATAVNYVPTAEKLPPYLYLVGDEDDMIPVTQGDRFCKKLREYGGRAEIYKISGAGHTYGCWTDEVLALIAQFLRANLTGKTQRQ